MVEEEGGREGEGDGKPTLDGVGEGERESESKIETRLKPLALALLARLPPALNPLMTWLLALCLPAAAAAAGACREEGSEVDNLEESWEGMEAGRCQ